MDMLWQILEYRVGSTFYLGVGMFWAKVIGARLLSGLGFSDWCKFVVMRWAALSECLVCFLQFV